MLDKPPGSFRRKFPPEVSAETSSAGAGNRSDRNTTAFALSPSVLSVHVIAAHADVIDALRQPGTTLKQG
jgi:hypothetical protein